MDKRLQQLAGIKYALYQREGNLGGFAISWEEGGPQVRVHKENQLRRDKAVKRRWDVGGLDSWGMWKMSTGDAVLRRREGEPWSKSRNRRKKSRP
ncbi:hypothetical protein HPP92_004617 [Vanilla planifolia]|uniref:Uncharacterized protein n=1 Tax=Vanilla planifolia TaxID=51239 RepID=A0A835VAJ3_VANPL|nr:hypothetical protein HPP92_004970 [Vanilla planifolia]KAG0493623.1 hypothetical protein HPP92_004617 [Vanilla planifolia]